MFTPDAITYELNPAVQILDENFTPGYIITKLDAYGNVVSKNFSSLTKAGIIEKLKKDNGFQTEAQKVLNKLMEETDV